MNDATWATDAALDDVLDRITDGRPMPTDQQTDDFIGNRRRKYRRRRRVLEDYLVTRIDHIYPNAIPRLEIIDAVAPLVDAEIKTLLRLGTGSTYAEVAGELRRPIGSVKISAHRARIKLAA